MVLKASLNDCKDCSLPTMLQLTGWKERRWKRLWNKQIYVEYLRTVSTWHCPHSSTCRAHSRKPAAVGLLLWAHVGTERGMDTVPLHRPCSTWHGWLGSRVVSVLDSGTEGPRVKIVVATLSSNSLRQTVYTHCASVHQAAKLVAAPLRVAGVAAGLAESNGSLPSGLWFTSPAGWLPRTGISFETLRSVIEYGLPLPFLVYSEASTANVNYEMRHNVVL